MSRFTHLEYSLEHAGVARAERVIDSAKRLVRHADGNFGAIALYLAAVGSAVLVFAGQVVGNWSDTALLFALLTLWVVAFASIAVVSGAFDTAARAFRNGTARRQAARRQRVEADKLWELGYADPRVMSDLAYAMSRDTHRDVRGYY